MELKILSLLFIISFFSVNAQNSFIENDNLINYFKKNKNIPIQKIQLDLEIAIKNARNYRVKKNFNSIFIKNLDKSNTKPKNYITFSELPEIHSSKTLLRLFRKKQKDLNYRMYHTEKESSVDIDDLHASRRFPFSETLNLRFISSFIKKKEFKKKEFKFYSSVDSIKVLYSYRYPLKVDTIRLNIGNTKTNKYGITLERYKDYGVIANLPYKTNLKIIDVAGVDKNGKTLLSVVRDKYYDFDSTEDNIEQLQDYYFILLTLYNKINNGDIKNITDFKSEVSLLKKQHSFIPISKNSLHTKKYLLQVFGHATEVVLYIESEEHSISKNVVVYKKQKEHTIFSSYSDSSINYRSPNNFFYNKKKKKKLITDSYYDIDFLGSNYFSVKNKDKKCERLFSNKKHKIEHFDDCSGNPIILSNGGVLIEHLDKYGIDQKSIKIYDKYGTLKFDNNNATPINQKFIDSHFIVISKDEETKFMLGNYSLTNSFDAYHIYSNHKAMIFKENKCGVIDDFGKILVPFKYTECQLIGSNNLLVTKGSKQYIISDLNKIIYKETTHRLEPIISLIKSPNSLPYLNLVTFKDHNLLGIKDLKGNIIFSAKAKEIFEVGINRIAIRLENDLLGVINEKGKTIIPFQFEEINPFYSKYAILINDNEKKFTFYDFYGNIEAIHHAKESYKIWKVLYNPPTLVIDDKIYIRYNGNISEIAE